MTMKMHASITRYHWSNEDPSGFEITPFNTFITDEMKTNLDVTEPLKKGKICSNEGIFYFHVAMVPCEKVTSNICPIARI